MNKKPPVAYQPKGDEVSRFEKSGVLGSQAIHVIDERNMDDDKVVFDNLSSDDEVNTFDYNGYMENLKRNLDTGICSVEESWQRTSIGDKRCLFGLDDTSEQSPY